MARKYFKNKYGDLFVMTDSETFPGKRDVMKEEERQKLLEELKKGPHVDGVNNDYHVHVEKGSIKGAERLNGGKSHGKTLDSAGVPKSVQKKVKETADWEKGLEKQKKLDNERAKASKLSWSDIILQPVILITGLAAAAGLTVWQIIKAGPSFIFG